MMKSIFGLGNSGLRYKNTRHNMGFLVIDFFVKQNRKMKRIKKSYAQIYKDEEKNVFYVKPLHYMNLSGIAVKKFLFEFGYGEQVKNQIRFKLQNDNGSLPALHSSEQRFNDFLVVFDDYHLPFGQLRFRRKGSSGGHNGVESIIQELGTSDFHRLRIGIGEPTDCNPVDYVLSPFKPQERKNLDELINLSAEAITCYIEKGIDEAMNKYNKKSVFDIT